MHTFEISNEKYIRLLHSDLTGRRGVNGATGGEQTRCPALQTQRDASTIQRDNTLTFGTGI